MKQVHMKFNTISPEAGMVVSRESWISHITDSIIGYGADSVLLFKAEGV